MIKEQINKHKVSAWWWASSVRTELNLQPELIKKLGREVLCTLSSGNNVCFRSMAEKNAAAFWPELNSKMLMSFFLLTFCVLYSKKIYYKAFRSIIPHTATLTVKFTLKIIIICKLTVENFYSKENISLPRAFCMFSTLPNTVAGFWSLKFQV